MVSEAHCMSFSCTELLLFNYAKVKTVFHSMAPLKQYILFEYLFVIFFILLSTVQFLFNF